MDSDENDHEAGPALENTTDPLLQRAIVDAVHHKVAFKLPASESQAVRPVTSFASVRAVLAPQRAVVAGGAMSLPVPAPVAAPAVLPKDEPLKTAAAEINLLPAARVKKPAWGWHGVAWGWLAGIAALGVFGLLNLGLYAYYSNRVYPGVQVGVTQLGGVPLSDLRQRLAEQGGEETLSVTAGGATYAMDMRGLGGLDLDRLEREVKEVGRTTPLPLAGVLRSLTSRPLESHYQVSDEGLARVIAGLERQINHQSSNALPMIVAGQAFTLAQKTGEMLDASKAAAAIRAVYGSGKTASLEVSKLEPLVAATAYKTDVEEAQARLGLTLQLRVRSSSYSPTAAQIGSWLVFGEPGRGVVVDGAAVAAYVASIPGRFDRRATTNAVVAAVQAKQNLNYTASRRTTATPNLASAAAVLPRQTYNYCLRPDEGAEAEALRTRAAAVLGSGGWTLGGRLRFVPASSNCDFTVGVVPADDMATVNVACTARTTCQVGSQLAVSAGAWAAAPAGWKGNLDEYRSELIQHEVGHWLGFDHVSCLSTDAPKPILQAPTVVLAGCSPNWYAVPVETLGTKVLPQF